jgi:hypothetical protein
LVVDQEHRICMTVSRSICTLLAFFVLAAATPAIAATPWAMIARRAIGRVEKMTKPPEGDQPGIDVATVVLSANASKVYGTTAAMLHRNAQVHVASESADRRTIEFSSGSRSASITVTDLGARLSQMVVAAAIKPGQNPATAEIVDGILRVCRSMRITCSER